MPYYYDQLCGLDKASAFERKPTPAIMSDAAGERFFTSYVNNATDLIDVVWDAFTYVNAS